MGSTPTRPTDMQIFLLIALFIAVLAVIFAVQNNDSATVAFALWKFEGSMALMLLISMAAGALMSIFVSMPSNIRARWTIRQQRKKMMELEASLSGLREQMDLMEKKLAQMQSSPTLPVSSALPETTVSEPDSDLDLPGELQQNGE